VKNAFEDKDALDRARGGRVAMANDPEMLVRIVAQRCADALTPLDLEFVERMVADPLVIQLNREVAQRIVAVLEDLTDRIEDLETVAAALARPAAA
jgi:hypothetical protein